MTRKKTGRTRKTGTGGEEGRDENRDMEEEEDQEEARNDLESSWRTRRRRTGASRRAGTGTGRRAGTYSYIMDEYLPVVKWLFKELGTPFERNRKQNFLGVIN